MATELELEMVDTIKQMSSTVKWLAQSRETDITTINENLAEIGARLEMIEKALRAIPPTPDE